MAWPLRSFLPNVVVQQIANTLAVRQINPDKSHGFELVWMHFGHADDDAQLRAIYLKQRNLKLGASRDSRLYRWLLGTQQNHDEYFGAPGVRL